MDGDCPVVGLMDGIPDDVRLGHMTNQVEMDGVSSQLECLPHIEELTVCDPADQRFITMRVKHDVGSESVLA